MTTKRKHYGRAKNPTFYTYEQAREKVQKERIQSRRQYDIWINARYRKGMPKHPHAVYKDAWNGWGEFLGTKNSFNTRTQIQYKGFTDALSYARNSGITTFENWCQVKHPDDIPVRADIVYKGQFKGWKHFLGTGKYSSTAIVEKAKKGESDLLWIVSSHLYGPENILNVKAFKDKDKLIRYLKENDLRFVKAFKNHPDLNVFEVLEKHGKPYGDDDWLVENLNDAIFDICLRCV